MSLQLLVEKLQTLRDGSSETEPSDYLTDDGATLAPETRDLVNEIVSLADKELVSEGGRPVTDNIAVLEVYGFWVRPGEQDSFGWLTGVIHTPKGRVVFG